MKKENKITSLSCLGYTNLQVFKKQESYKKGIISSTLLNIGSKGIGFGNSLLLVYFFGSNMGTDAYFLVLSIVAFVASFVNGIVPYIIIPEAMRVREHKGLEAEQGYINFFVWLYTVIGIIIALTVLLAPLFFYSLFSKYSISQLDSQHKLLIVSSILFPLNLLLNIFMTVLASHKYFTVPMLVSTINNIIGIVFLLLFSKSVGISAAAAGLAIGSIVNLIWLVYYLKRKLNWNFLFVTKPSKSNWRDIVLMEINVIPVAIQSYVTLYMLSGLGAGIITSYNYGSQIALIPEVMIVTQLLAIINIKYNELSSQNKLEEIDRLFRKSMQLLFFLLLPLGYIIFLLSHEILAVLFIFKKKSELVALKDIAGFMGVFAVILPFRALDLMLSGITTAQQKIKEGVLFATILHISIAILIYLAANFFSLKGFYFITVFTYGILMPVFYYFFIQNVTPFIKITKWVKESALFVLLITIGTIGIYFLKMYVLYKYGLVINVLAVVSIMVAFTLLINKKIKFAEYNTKF